MIESLVTNKVRLEEAGIASASLRFATLWSSGFAKLLPRAAGLSGLTILGQLSFLLALPFLSRLFSPSALGLFTLYLSVVNIAGPLVGLKFESALFGQPDRRERCVSLRLSVTVITVMSAIGTILLAVVVPKLKGDVGNAIQSLFIVLPFGIFLSGMWNTSTAWAVREGAIRTLSIARFLQPFSMTVLQVIFGLMQLSPIWLVVAHLVSHIVYSGFIFLRSLTRDDLLSMARSSSRTIMRRAMRDYRFPVFVMPAFFMTVLINNAPPLLMGAIFGTSLAGHYGVAYRVVTSPLTVICMPLANLFTSEASHSGNAVHLQTVTRFVLTFSICFVAIPVLLFGLVAPEVSVALLGPKWALAGRIMTALAFMGAAQAVASPLSEVPSIYHRQKVRLGVDTVQLFLFFAPLAIGYASSWDALKIIQVMAAGGAAGYALNSVASLLILRGVIANAATPDGLVTSGVNCALNRDRGVNGI